MKEKKQNPIAEVYEEFDVAHPEGRHSTENGRKSADTLYSILLVGGLLLVGLVLLVLSVFVKAMSDWTVGGIVFILFGLLLLMIGGKTGK